MRNRGGWAETQAQREAGSLSPSRTPGSRPGLKADAQPLSHPGVPPSVALKGTKIDTYKEWCGRRSQGRKPYIPMSQEGKEVL